MTIMKNASINYFTNNHHNCENVNINNINDDKMFKYINESYLPFIDEEFELKSKTCFDGFMEQLFLIEKENESDLSDIPKRDLIKALKMASLLLQKPDENFNIRSYFEIYIKNRLRQTTYWADKILIDLNVESDIFRYLSESLFPTKEFLVDISENVKDMEILKSLYTLNVIFPPNVLPPLNSVLVPSSRTKQQDMIINTGTYIKRMCWAPVNPELHQDQFLAVSAYNEFKGQPSKLEDCQMIQIYNCGQLGVNSKEVSAPHLEMVLIHDWGKVTDMIWSPQSLPAVSRSQKLIGHLALCCIDGYVKIVPICQLHNLSRFVSLNNRQSILNLDSGLNQIEQVSVFPTTMHWRKEFYDRIIVGYNSGHVAQFVLQASVFSTQSQILKIDIHLKPTHIIKVFNDPCCSVQISPSDCNMVVCSSFFVPNAVRIDFTQRLQSQIVTQIDIDNNIGSRIIWPVSGDILIFSVKKHVPHGKSVSGLVLCSTQNPSEIFKKLFLPNISSMVMCHSFDILLIGTRSGKMHTFNLCTNKHQNWISCSSCNDSQESVPSTKLCVQYGLDSIDSESKIKADIGVQKTNFPLLNCNCSPYLQCIHRLRSKFSISINKEFHKKSNDLQRDTMLNIHEIAPNPNYVSNKWIAIALECGLIHLMSLNRSNSYEIFNENKVSLIEEPKSQLFDNVIELKSEGGKFSLKKKLQKEVPNTSKNHPETSQSFTMQNVCKPCFVYLEKFSKNSVAFCHESPEYEEIKQNSNIDSLSQKNFSNFFSSSPSPKPIPTREKVKKSRSLSKNSSIPSNVLSPLKKVCTFESMKSVKFHENVSEPLSQLSVQNEINVCGSTSNSSFNKDMLDDKISLILDDFKKYQIDSVNMPNIQENISVKRKKVIHRSRYNLKKRLTKTFESDRLMVDICKINNINITSQSDLKLNNGARKKINRRKRMFLNDFQFNLSRKKNLKLLSVPREMKLSMDNESESNSVKYIEDIELGSQRKSDNNSVETLVDCNCNLKNYVDNSVINENNYFDSISDSSGLVGLGKEIIFEKDLSSDRLNSSVKLIHRSDSYDNCTKSSLTNLKNLIISISPIKLINHNQFKQSEIITKIKNHENGEDQSDKMKNTLNLEQESQIYNYIPLRSVDTVEIKTINNPLDSEFGKLDSLKNLKKQRVTNPKSSTITDLNMSESVVDDNLTSTSCFSNNKTNSESELKNSLVSDKLILATNTRNSESKSMQKKSLKEFSTYSKSSRPSWWGTDYYFTKENNLDLNNDDISTSTNVTSSPLKRVPTNFSVEDRMDKIQKVINQGICQSRSSVKALNNDDDDDSPQLLQPFRSLKQHPRV